MVFTSIETAALAVDKLALLVLIGRREIETTMEESVLCETLNHWNDIDIHEPSENTLVRNAWIGRFLLSNIALGVEIRAASISGLLEIGIDAAFFEAFGSGKIAEFIERVHMIVILVEIMIA